MTAYLYEFLYRGRPAGSSEPPAWHVVLAQDFALPGSEPQTMLSPALTPEQAEAAGYALSEIVEGINAAALADRDARIAELATVAAERDALTAQRDAGDAADIAALQAELRDQQAIARQALEHAESLSAQVEAAERERQEREANALQAGTEIAQLKADLDAARQGLSARLVDLSEQAIPASTVEAMVRNTPSAFEIDTEQPDAYQALYAAILKDIAATIARADTKVDKELRNPFVFPTA